MVKLIRQRDGSSNPVNTSMSGNNNQIIVSGRIRSPTSGNTIRNLDHSGNRAKQQAAYIMGPVSTKNNVRQEFFFSATSPPVQINK